jgi:transketolase
MFFGVREFAMAAAVNGMALHGGIIPYGGTFLVFSDYARNALRIAALMKVGSIFVFTHDSIGLGEDGPTHQPVEHAASLRYIPNMDVWRPCDAVETTAAWIAAIERRDGPTCLLLTRQNVPHQSRTADQLQAIARGGYVLADGEAAQAVIIATGSEVALAMSARQILAQKNVRVRVVSMPSTGIFDRQDAAYRDSVLPKTLPRVAVEAGVTDFWRKYVGLDGEVVGIDRFGESAPAGELFKHFGLTAEAVAEAVERLLKR